MKPDLFSVLEQCSTKGWKKVPVEFTGGPLVISVPKHCVAITMKKAEALKNPAREISSFRMGGEERPFEETGS